MYLNSGIEVVTFFSVLRKIQTLDLVIRGNPQPDRLIDNKEQNRSYDDRNEPRNSCARGLVAKLRPVPVEPARWQWLAGSIIAKRGIDGAYRKDAGEKRAQRSAHAMHAKGIQRGVIPELALDNQHHEGAEESGDQATRERGHRLHITGSRRTRHQAGYRAGNRAQCRRLAVVEPFKDAPA